MTCSVVLMMVSRGMGFSSDTGNPRIINCLKQFVFLLIMFKTLIQLNSTVDTLLLKYTFYLVSWFILNIYKTALWLNENSTQCYYIFIAARVIFKCTDVIISSHIVFCLRTKTRMYEGPSVTQCGHFICLISYHCPSGITRTLSLSLSAPPGVTVFI